MSKISVYGYIGGDLSELRPRLQRIVTDRGGWIHEEGYLSFARYALRFEISLAQFSEAYGALQESGIEFTPAAHQVMAQMCYCQKHLRKTQEVPLVSVELSVGALEEENRRIQRLLRSQCV